ncbi:MAG: hypothetical protein JF589_06315 [Gemmatimonadetes bacterium]|nr:hypothetical protein [Gemmatimonadota bacterium]
MSSVPQNHDAAKYRTSPEEPVTYPEQQVLAVFDDEEALAAAIEELTRVGVPDSDLDVACGTERADALRASTGRSGLANLAIRIADQLGIKNTEMEAKARYEEAMRAGGYVLRVSAPTDEQKSQVVEALQRHGAHGISYFSKFTIERIVPHNQP